MKIFFIISIILTAISFAQDIYNSQQTTRQFFDEPITINNLVTADFSNLP